MKCPKCGTHVPVRRRRRRHLTDAYTMAAPALPSVVGMGNPPPQVQSVSKITCCLGCGVLFVREFKANETCPMCLKTVGWKEVGQLTHPVT